MGPQGSGKGTQAKRLAETHGVAHVATGDILRAAVAAGTDLGRQVQPILERYLRGTGMPAKERSKLYKLVWDAMYSEFAGRHGLYELNYAGNHEQKYLDALSWAERRGLMNQFEALVDECLAQYDLDGWRDPAWSWSPDGSA